MKNIIAFLIIFIVAGAVLIMSPETIPRQISDFGSPVLTAGLLGLVIFVILKFFRVV